jgi:regulator of cell morphogenesis and NO signaling
MKGTGEPVVDALAMTLPELTDHIEKTHHAYLRSEIPRITVLAEKVATVHGGEDPRLVHVRDVFHGFARDLTPHVEREEKVLFPMLKKQGAGIATPAADNEALPALVRQMESEHDGAGVALARLRELTDGYAPPGWACNSYRALLDALARLERDMHQHVHKENNILYPKAIKQEGAHAGKTG